MCVRTKTSRQQGGKGAKGIFYASFEVEGSPVASLNSSAASAGKGARVHEVNPERAKEEDGERAKVCSCVSGAETKRRSLCGTDSC